MQWFCMQKIGHINCHHKRGDGLTTRLFTGWNLLDVKLGCQVHEKNRTKEVPAVSGGKEPVFCKGMRLLVGGFNPFETY